MRKNAVYLIGVYKICQEFQKLDFARMFQLAVDSVIGKIQVILLLKEPFIKAVQLELTDHLSTGQ